MYVEIKENKLLSWCENPYSDYEFVDIDFLTFDVNKYEVQNGQLVDISQTQEYLDKIAQEQQEIQNKKTITKRQLLFWLFLNKQKTEDDIFEAINTISDSANRYLGEVSYKGTNSFEFGNPFVPVIGQALGLTPEELVTMFDEAGSL